MVFFLMVGCTFYPAKTGSYDGQPSPQGVKITAAPDRMVAIPLRQLQPYGLPSTNQEEWVLSFRGKEIPFWFFGENPQKFVFYSPPTRSPYWKDNVFLFQPKSSLSLLPDPELSTFLWEIELPPTSMWEKQPIDSVLSYSSLEQNLLYQSLAEGDHWFWTKLTNNQGQDISIKFEVPPTGEILLRLSLYSATEAPLHPDHGLQLLINNVSAYEVFWDGKGYQNIDLWIPAEIFHPGENQLTLSTLDIAGIIAQLSYLDRVDLYYWQMLPLGTQTHQFKFFTKDQSALAELEIPTQDTWIWNIADPLQPRLLTKNEDFVYAGEPRRFLYVPSENFYAPTELRSLEAETAPVLEEAEINYLAVGTHELMAPLKPLLDRRQQEGLAVKAVEVEEIYAWYYGFAEPQAIREYLAKMALEHPSLRYVLLVGDATYDPAQNITRAELNRLPTFFIDTIYGGQTSTEIPFSILDQRSLEFLKRESSFHPSVSVGRLPANSPQQVRQWVSKVLEYEKGEMKPRSEAILAIADPRESYFSRDATAFMELWNANMRKDLFLPTAGETELRERIQNYFQMDYQIITYFGHGAIDLWGKDEIFTAQEAQGLSGQGSYPLVLNFTCLTGYYIHPELMSLTESLLWNPKGGAILIVGPTSLTLADDQSFLWKAFVESYQGREHNRIGDVWLNTISRIFLTNEGIRDVVMTYTLFGDPAMTLP